MSDTELDNGDETPLDPEMEKVRRKMVRLLAVSLGIMFLGVMAVLAGVVYKVIGDDGSPERIAETLPGPNDPPLDVTAVLPEGFRVDDISLDGSKILFFGRTSGGATRAYVFDMLTERVAATVDIRD